MRIILIAVFTMTVFLMSCATFSEKDAEICKDQAESLICQNMSPTTADFALMLVNLEGIQRSSWTKEQAAEFFNETETVIKSTETWMDLTTWLIREVKVIRESLGVEILFLSAYMNMAEFNAPTPINSYDRHLLLQHIQNQRDKVLALF